MCDVASRDPTIRNLLQKNSDMEQGFSDVVVGIVSECHTAQLDHLKFHDTQKNKLGVGVGSVHLGLNVKHTAEEEKKAETGTLSIFCWHTFEDAMRDRMISH